MNAVVRKITLPRRLRLRSARLLTLLTIGWASLLPLLVPFGTSRNIDLQGIVLILAGTSAWLALLLHAERQTMLNSWSISLIVTFAGFCLIDLCITPHLGYNLLGSPYIRLGSLGLISCMGIGLLALKLERKVMSRYLYWYIVAIAVASLLYSVRFGHLPDRIGGVFDQADVLACIVGCGLLLGWRYCTWKTTSGRGFIALQMFLLGLLLLTQTRAVIVLTVLLSGWLLYRSKQLKLAWLLLTLATLIAIGLLANRYAPANRLHDASYAKDSVTYRLQLNEAALAASYHRPIAGYGPGNLADALACNRLHAKPLLQTCDDGFFFNSSHDIYIDRLLGLGWAAGVAYLGIVGLALWCGRQAGDLQAVRILITLYYLTNVTSITLELLCWIVLLQGLAYGKSTRS